MKLYNITSTERASKGQGGNKYLKNDIYIIDRVKPSYTLEIEESKDGYTIQLINHFFGKDIIVYNSIQFINK